MKKALSVSLTIVCALAFLFGMTSPVSAAAGFVVSTVQTARSGAVIVYLEYGSTPYYAVTTTFSRGIGYPTVCGPNGAGFLKCVISSQLAKNHANQTAYIIMNGTDDNKAYFVVPEFSERRGKPDCGDDQCCNDCD